MEPNTFCESKGMITQHWMSCVHFCNSESFSRLTWLLQNSVPWLWDWHTHFFLGVSWELLSCPKSPWSSLYVAFLQALERPCDNMAAYFFKTNRRISHSCFLRWSLPNKVIMSDHILFYIVFCLYLCPILFYSILFIFSYLNTDKLLKQRYIH